MAGLAIGLAAAAKCDPRFYSHRVGATTPTDERLARTLITKAARLGAAADGPGPWAVAIAEREINAWLTLDLPRNHAGLLPPGMSEPRLELLPGRVRGAARFGAGWLSAVGWADLDVRPRDGGRLVASVTAAGLGLVPLPHGIVLRSLERHLGRAGLPTELVRVDGGSVLMIHLTPAAGGGKTPDSILIDGGEVIVSGGTRVARNHGRRR